MRIYHQEVRQLKDMSTEITFVDTGEAWVDEEESKDTFVETGETWVDEEESKHTFVEKCEAWVDEQRFKNPLAYRLALNEDGQINIQSIIMLGISAIIIAAFIPTAIDSLATADTTGWGSTDVAIYGIIGTVILIVIILGFLKVVR